MERISGECLDFTNDPLCVVDTSITIPLERYNELIRKEIGYEVRRAELLKMNLSHSAEDTVIYQLDTVPVDDDF